MAGNRVQWTALVLTVSLLGLPPALAPVAAASDPGPQPTDVVVSFDTLPSGLGLELDGARTPTPHSFVCAQGSGHTLTATSPLSDGRTTHTFRNWTDGFASSTRSFVCDVAQDFVAVYGVEHLIEVDTQPRNLIVIVNGNVSTSPVFLWCAQGATVDLFALDDVNGTLARQFFGNWSDGGAQEHTVLCNGPAVYTAFYRVQYRISVFTQPQGLQVRIDGDPSATPAFFWCEAPTTHRLDAANGQAVGGTEFRFDRWADGESSSTRTIPCDRPTNYTAVYIEATPPTPFVSGAAWPFVVLLALMVLVPLLAAGIATAVRRRRLPARVLVPARGGAPPGRPGAVPWRWCPRCGASAEPDWMYCLACGASLR